MGLGLFELERLVLQAKGTLWVYSGDAQKTLQSGAWNTNPCHGIEWQGVIIGIEIPITAATKSDVRDYDSESSTGALRKELGL
jgi:hypothetical protein